MSNGFKVFSIAMLMAIVAISGSKGQARVIPVDVPTASITQP